MSDHATSESNGASAGSESAPPYAVPAVNEEIRILDWTTWRDPVPAVYLGYERISGDFFMHRVRSASGLESTLAPHDVFRRHEGAGGKHWQALTKRPRVR